VWPSSTATDLRRGNPEQKKAQTQAKHEGRKVEIRSKTKIHIAAKTHGTCIDRIEIYTTPETKEAYTEIHTETHNTRRQRDQKATPEIYTETPKPTCTKP
jgi:hypothetical protein